MAITFMGLFFANQAGDGSGGRSGPGRIGVSGATSGTSLGGGIAGRSGFPLGGGPMGGISRFGDGGIPADKDGGGFIAFPSRGYRAPKK